MSNERYYLTSDDIRQQQRINRAVAELIDPAPVVNRRREAADGTDGWSCKIVEADNGDITLIPVIGLVSDDYAVVRFRGQTYTVGNSWKFSLAAADLDTPVYLYLVKEYYSSAIRFVLALSHKNIRNTSSGCVRLAVIQRTNGRIQSTMDYLRPFEIDDQYEGHGRFAADLVFSGIRNPYASSQPIQFYEFTQTAEQRLAIDRNYAMLVNGVYYLGITASQTANPVSGCDIFTPAQYAANLPIQVFWAADGDFTLYNIRYKLENRTAQPYRQDPGTLRIPLLTLSAIDSATNLRSFLFTQGAPNYPEVANSFGYGFTPDKCGWIVIDHTAQTVRMDLRIQCDGSSYRQLMLNAAFTLFSSAGSGKELYVVCRYNRNTHTWKSLWFELDTTPITTYTSPTSGDISYRYLVGVIGWNSTAGHPYVIGQNFARVICFSSLDQKYAALDQRVTAIEQRVTALEQRN